MGNGLKKEWSINKWGKAYNGFKIFVFFLALLFFIIIASKVTERKDSIKKYSDFAQLSKQIDVLFLGSSHMLNGVNPLQLYAEYGVTSYNMAKNGGLITEAYWTMVNALDYCNPKCVVIDIWGLERDYQYIDIDDDNNRIVDGGKATSFLHDNFDFWPLTKNKINAVNDLVFKSEIKKEFFWEFMVYHDRWSSLNVDDFRLAVSNSYADGKLGASLLYSVDPTLCIYQPEKNENLVSDKTIAIQYLYKILDECEKRNIKVIFTFLPMALFEENDWSVMNTAERIAAERDVLFLNLLPHELQNVVNYKTDFFDITHANVFGMSKLTSYLGKYLSEVDGIEDHRADAKYQVWADKVEQWQAGEIQKMLNESNLYTELGLIYNVNANAVVFMKGNSQALQDPIIQEFVMQLSGTQNVLEAARCNGPYLLIREDTSGGMQVQEIVGEQIIESVETVFGDTYYIGLKDFSAIYVDEAFENNYLDMEDHYKSEVQITILGNEGEIMSQMYYDPND